MAPAHAGSVAEEPWVRCRVCCIDDDTLIRDGLAALLQRHTLTHTYRDVESFLSERPDCDVVLLDLRLGGFQTSSDLAGASAVRAVSDAGYRVLIYSSERRPAVLVGCLSNGARGVAHKSEPLADLESAVSRVARDQIVITTGLTGLAELSERRGALPSLSNRQKEVLSARARGEPFRSIAARLYLSPKTVEEYMAEVARKFADYLATHSATDLERSLGLGPGDLLAWRVDIARGSR